MKLFDLFIALLLSSKTNLSLLSEISSCKGSLNVSFKNIIMFPVNNPTTPNIIIGLIFKFYAAFLMKGHDILPNVPAAEHNPRAKDLTTVGNNSDRYMYANDKTQLMTNLMN